MLGADGKERGERLQTGLDEEKGRTRGSSNDTRSSTSEDVNTQRLNLSILVYCGCQTLAQRFVETQTATVEQDLVDILQWLLAIQVSWTLIGERTAEPIPRKRPRGPSFCRITFTPCKTPRYFLAASCLACSSPCSCRLSYRYKLESGDTAGEE